jgi:signal transduction histidine kinase
VAQAARSIASGDLNSRLDLAVESELRELTSSFNDMVDQLSQRMQRDRRFAADVSHELRSPLQTLSAADAVLTRRRDQLDQRSAAAADLVADEVSRFQHLVTDLLELSRGDQRPDCSDVDVGALARQVCRAKGVGEDVVGASGDAIWRLDRRRLEQVLGNLVDNANRYGGGPVAVRLSRAGGLRAIEVDDEGPGVVPEEREVIFQRFVRGRGVGARADGEGTGLGLALVASHVDVHGGRVMVTDRPGGGARFRVELPEIDE